ncbi:xylose isomerase [Haloprofundus marisrubri]|uniref:Xylose isomerase n=1 Tax=Haloprofundus marisrubri TaxID=1514971 RepID=A0A0W1RB18_9EURY|nr:sugar phosphate isomerase/epimerase family protein [Haloprofundus marisrubri]KTG10293.1 xylose isomerase [Haloprofundus marisrubri]
MDARTGFVTQMNMDLDAAIEAAAEYDFDYVEVMMDGDAERRRLDDRADEIRSALDERGLGLQVHLPFGGIDLGSPFEHVRAGSVAEQKAAIDTAAALGAEKGVLHPTTGAWSPAWDRTSLRNNVLESVRELVAHAAEHEFEVCAENIPRSVFRTHEFPQLLAETKASMTLDTGHARMDGRDTGGIASFVEEHSSRISHVHLNDTRQASDEHLPFGAGNLGFERIFGAFPADWTGTLSLEVFTFGYDYIETSKRHLDELLADY